MPNHRQFLTGLMAALALAVLGMAPLSAYANDATADKNSAEELVSEAKHTLEKVKNHPDLGPFVKKYLKQAKAVIILPQFLKGGFIVGGEGGSGVLLARDASGDWSYPAFYSMGAASIGLQIGGQSSEVLLLVMTGNGLQSILKDQVKIGGELEAAAGPYGAGMDASTTTNMNVDILSYSVTQGLYIGVNFEGALIVPRDGLNESYYNRPMQPEDIILNGQVGNPQADDLRAALRRAIR